MPHVTLRYERIKLYEEVWAEAVSCSSCRPLHLELRGARDAAKPPGRRVSVLGDLPGLQATWRPTSCTCNRVTGALTGACVAVLWFAEICRHRLRATA